MSKRKEPSTVELPEKVSQEVKRLINRTGSGGRMESRPTRTPWVNRVATRRAIADTSNEHNNTNDESNDKFDDNNRNLKISINNNNTNCTANSIINLYDSNIVNVEIDTNNNNKNSTSTISLNINGAEDKNCKNKDSNIEIESGNIESINDNILNNEIDENESTDKSIEAKKIDNITKTECNNYSLVNLNDLNNKISAMFHCKLCVSYNEQVNTNVYLVHNTVGIATNISLKCENGHCIELQSTFIPNDSGKFLKQQTQSLKNYGPNHHMILGMMVNGLGFSGLSVLVGVLGLSTVGLKSWSSTPAWKKMKTDVNNQLISLANEICIENLQKEILATKKKYPNWHENYEDRFPVAVSLDSGWQKRSSGSRYDSSSSHCLIVGGVSKEILGYEVFSKSCAKCDYKIHDEYNDSEDDEESIYSNCSDFSDHEDDVGEEINLEVVEEVIEKGKKRKKIVKEKVDHKYKEVIDPYIPLHPNCPKNFSGSSKSMEPIGAVLLVTRLFREGSVWVHTVITDDDSTTRAALHHSLNDLMEKKLMTKLEWPKNNGAYKLDNGKLPLDVPEPKMFLADPSHRKKVYSGYMYKIATDTKIKGFSKNDAKNLKDNFGYAQSQHVDDDVPTFSKRFVAAIEHVFNKHDNCDSSWCEYHNNQHLTETKGKERYKDVSFPCYKHVREVHDKLTTYEKLSQVHHSFNTQKNESLNRSVAKQAPKTITFCKTNSLKGRVAFVVCVASIGYEATVERFCSILQIAFPESIRQTWKELDYRKNFKRKYDNTPLVKRRRTRVSRESMKQQRLEENTSKKAGYYYQSGIALADVDQELQQSKLDNDKRQVGVFDEKVSAAKELKPCVCGAITHRRTTSHKCRIWQEKNQSLTQCVQTSTEQLVQVQCTDVHQLGEMLEKEASEKNT